MQILEVGRCVMGSDVGGSSRKTEPRASFSKGWIVEKGQESVTVAGSQTIGGHRAMGSKLGSAASLPMSSPGSAIY